VCWVLCFSCSSFFCLFSVTIDYLTSFCCFVYCCIILLHNSMSSSSRSVDRIFFRSLLVWLCLPSASNFFVFMAWYSLNFCYYYLSYIFFVATFHKIDPVYLKVCVFVFVLLFVCICCVLTAINKAESSWVELSIFVFQCFDTVGLAIYFARVARNDLFCVGWNIKHYSLTHRSMCTAHRR